jgi:hypothetical protein
VSAATDSGAFSMYEVKAGLQGFDGGRDGNPHQGFNGGHRYWCFTTDQ